MSAAVKIRETAKNFSEVEWVEKIQTSTNQIWLAGLGAVSSAQEESSKLFDSLVKQGQEFEQRTSSKVKDARKQAESRLDDVKVKANSSIEKLEFVFEERVKAVLKKLGIPTQEDLQTLNSQIEELRASLEPKKKRLR